MPLALRLLMSRHHSFLQLKRLLSPTNLAVCQREMMGHDQAILTYVTKMKDPVLVDIKTDINIRNQLFPEPIIGSLKYSQN
jgi:hypothetical protein